jgi:hypothetical protein
MPWKAAACQKASNVRFFYSLGFLWADILIMQLENPEDGIWKGSENPKMKLFLLQRMR